MNVLGASHNVLLEEKVAIIMLSEVHDQLWARLLKLKFSLLDLSYRNN